MVEGVRISSLIAALALCSVACASPKRVAAPFDSSGANREPVRPQPEWLTRHDLDHTLVGKIWDVKGQAFVAAAALEQRAARARFVLLGERHDNPDHHRLQALMIQKLLQAGRRPAVVLEMLELGQQAAIDEYRSRPTANAAGFGAALGWEKSGWPPAVEYQPIFDIAFAANLLLLAGNLAHGDARALVKQGVGAFSTERAKHLWLDQDFSAPLLTSLVEELRASHCGHLPEALLEPMALAQRARDAQMARVAVGAATEDGAVLIAGGGHVRLDRGVPYFIERLAPGQAVVSVLFREVAQGELDPRGYVPAGGPFDYLWFTPRGTDLDPCAAFMRPSR